jgi:ABC-type antimicrobial peptide transport system permease subunit
MPHAAVYTNALQMAPTGSQYSLITNGDPMALAPQARSVIAAIDSGLPLNALETYQERRHENLTGLMYTAAMLGMDGLIALLLAAIGIFGVMANVVGERTREIGVRLAMGASREAVMKMILRRASWLTTAGLGTGLAMAFMLARLLANLLRGVQPTDALVFTSISVVIVAVALAASWLPARRAARIDPMEALRSE